MKGDWEGFISKEETQAKKCHWAEKRPRVVKNGALG
jgi:hypothetical protein